MSSQALEDYLKIIYKLQESRQDDSKGISTSSIAERLGISNASVSNMLKKLASQNLIRYEPYYGVALLAEGKEIAIKMIRRHRVVELFLVERLNYSWDEVDEEAEVLEHAVSDKLIDRMWTDLGCPARDPHGSPIPNQKGEMIAEFAQCLACLPVDKAAKVIRIKNRSPEELRYLTSIGISQHKLLKVKHIAPFKGPVTIEIDNQVVAIDCRLADAIMVEITQ